MNPANREVAHSARRPTAIQRTVHAAQPQSTNAHRHAPQRTNKSGRHSNQRATSVDRADPEQTKAADGARQTSPLPTDLQTRPANEAHHPTTRHSPTLCESHRKPPTNRWNRRVRRLEHCSGTARRSTGARRHSLHAPAAATLHCHRRHACEAHCHSSPMRRSRVQCGSTRRARVAAANRAMADVDASLEDDDDVCSCVQNSLMASGTATRRLRTTQMPHIVRAAVSSQVHH
jgi:hypothetical protein